MTTEASELDGVLDIDAEASPLVARERLYRLWEEKHRSAQSLDARDWQEQQRRAILWNAAMFLDGGKSVTVTLAPFLRATPRDEDRAYLATQAADEARHPVFFDRFLREVCQIGQDYRSTLEAGRPQLTWGYRQVFAELERVSERLRFTPDSQPHLARGGALYHLVTEGMLVYTGQHYLRDYANRTDLFPGFKAGMNMVARNEAWHIAFGIQLLYELVTGNPACKAAALDILNRVLSWTAGVFTPPACDWTYVTCLGYTPQAKISCDLRSIESKVRRAEIAPSEVKALVKSGYADPPLEQAGRLIQPINGRVLGTDQAPQVNEAALDALFTSIAGIAHWTRVRHPTAACVIQWLFDKVQPCYAADWIRIATGQLDQQRAFLTSCLRPSVDLTLVLHLPRILPA